MSHGDALGLFEEEQEAIQTRFDNWIVHAQWNDAVARQLVLAIHERFKEFLKEMHSVETEIPPTLRQEMELDCTDFASDAQSTLQQCTHSVVSASPSPIARNSLRMKKWISKLRQKDWHREEKNPRLWLKVDFKRSHFNREMRGQAKEKNPRRWLKLEFKRSHFTRKKQGRA